MREMFVLGSREIILFRSERVGKWVFLDIVKIQRGCGLYKNMLIVLWGIFRGLRKELIISKY
jgi:hypothetical protein